MFAPRPLSELYVYTEMSVVQIFYLPLGKKEPGSECCWVPPPVICPILLGLHLIFKLVRFACQTPRLTCLLICLRRNFYYITMLRDPVSRYLSEWKHVQRGATWKTALHMCDGRPPTQDELPACYSGEDWTGVPLPDFMNCPSNLANNRQVRMLADLSLVGCYNMSSMSELERGRVLLASAKSNLRNMAFFGLTEFQRKTQYLFERTFGLHFIRPFTQINSTRAASVGISEKVRWRIEGLNALDMELYEYAKELFLRRYQYNRQRQHQEERLRRRQERQQRQRLHRTYLAELWRLGIGGGGAEEVEEEEVEVKVLEEVATTEDYGSQVVRW